MNTIGFAWFAAYTMTRAEWLSEQPDLEFYCGAVCETCATWADRYVAERNGDQ